MIPGRSCIVGPHVEAEIVVGGGRDEIVLDDVGGVRLAPLLGAEYVASRRRRRVDARPSDNAEQGRSLPIIELVVGVPLPTICYHRAPRTRPCAPVTREQGIGSHPRI